MITMDFEGVTWVGNIYHKFEAMCLEVEEIMYQDTVKYVENQVQTVGASVKKFYSDVVQDLLPPSSMDLVKVTASDLPLEKYANVGIYKKPKVGLKEEPIKIDSEELIEDLNVTADGVKDAGHALSFSELRSVNHLVPPSFGNCVEEACSDLNLGQNNDGRVYKKSNVGVKENPKNEKPSASEMSGVTTPVANLSGASLLCELLNENHEAGCDQIAMIPPPASVEVTGCDSEEGEICNEIEDATECIADVSIDFESFGNRGMEMRLSSSGGLSAGLIDTSTNNGVVSLVGSSMDGGNMQYSESTDKEFFMSYPGRSDECNIDAIKSNDIIELEIETIEQFDELKLEESCIMVDGDKLCFVCDKKGKHRSYKKKIRDAFCSKMRSARKQEYEQLAAQSGDNDTESNPESLESFMPSLPMDSDAKKLLTHDFCESEWELL